MAIEPINSAMTFTAQPVAAQMSTPRPVEKSPEEFTEGVYAECCTAGR